MGKPGMICMCVQYDRSKQPQPPGRPSHHSPANTTNRQADSLPELTDWPFQFFSTAWQGERMRVQRL